jgi:hypothetical protein
MTGVLFVWSYKPKPQPLGSSTISSGWPADREANALGPGGVFLPAFRKSRIHSSSAIRGGTAINMIGFITNALNKRRSLEQALGDFVEKQKHEPTPELARTIELLRAEIEIRKNRADKPSSEPVSPARTLPVSTNGTGETVVGRPNAGRWWIGGPRLALVGALGLCGIGYVLLHALG